MTATLVPNTTEPRRPAIECAAPMLFHLLFSSAAEALRWASALAASLPARDAGRIPVSLAERVVVWLDSAPSTGAGFAHAFVSRGAFEAAIAARIGTPVLDLVALGALPRGLRLAVGTSDDAALYAVRAGA